MGAAWHERWQEDKVCRMSHNRKTIVYAVEPPPRGKPAHIHSRLTAQVLCSVSGAVLVFGEKAHDILS